MQNEKGEAQKYRKFIYKKKIYGQYIKAETFNNKPRMDS